jgi:3-dehydroquinate synthase
VTERTNHDGEISPGASVDAPFAVDFLHRIRWTTDTFDPGNPALRDLMPADEGPARAVVFVDSGVADAWTDLSRRIEAYFVRHADSIALAAPLDTVRGGEACKNDFSVFEHVTRTINDAGICRRSYVIAIGGGAVLDAVGFGAATAHRGVRLIRMPTTTLSQGDSGVGVKNGINAFGKKNFVGAFSPPWAVLNDELFLSTLSDRDWRCGLSEAVKVALVKDADLFARIRGSAERLRARDEAALRPILRRTAQLHVSHIADGGDPFEVKHARPLDFGHWAAHKLEQISDFGLRHGEAVAIGIALDAAYANLIGRLSAAETDAVLRLLVDLGLPVYHDALAGPDLIGGLEEFREHLGGRLTIPLLEGIGRPFDAHEIDGQRMTEAAQRLATVGADTQP